MERNYDNFYSKMSPAKIAYDNEPDIQDWKLKRREKRKKLVAKGIVSFVPEANIGYLIKVNGYTVALLSDLRMDSYINHAKCSAVFDTVIAMMESE